MIKLNLRQLIIAKKQADFKLATMDATKKDQLEKSWDVEHAYYSSVLEGSKLDKKDFEQLAQAVK
ncbi:MAG: hypothetical protein V1711_00650 [bacterium]